jgi:hypothetical protein
MNCPQGWLCNEDCAYYLGIERCDYVEEVVNLKEIAATIEVRHIEKAKEDAEKIIRKNELGSLEWFYSTKPPDNSVLEPINAMSGSISFGGGGIKRKKSKKGNKPTTYVWGEIL